MGLIHTIGTPESPPNRKEQFLIVLRAEKAEDIPALNFSDIIERKALLLSNEETS